MHINENIFKKEKFKITWKYTRNKILLEVPTTGIFIFFP